MSRFDMRARGAGSLEPLRRSDASSSACVLQLGGLESRPVATLRPTRARARPSSRSSPSSARTGSSSTSCSGCRSRTRCSSSSAWRTTRESNTRFLLVHDNWRGLVIDGCGRPRSAVLPPTGLGWRHEIEAVTAFIDRDNINGLIGRRGNRGRHRAAVDRPRRQRLLGPRGDRRRDRRASSIAEYNATSGRRRRSRSPYDPAFVRREKHSSNLYWGASLAALAAPRARKGFRLVGWNLAGNNAFFVRDDVARPAGVEPAEAWRPAASASRAGRPASSPTCLGSPRAAAA